MRRGFARSLAAFLGGTAFAVAVAGPVQWCACPMHGAVLAPAVTHVHMAATGMDMPAGEPAPAPVASHSGHGVPDSHHAGHQCTCPGGCCGTTPVGLRAQLLRAPVALHVDVPARVDRPTDTVALAPSPQLALPFANAPPRLRVPLQNAAHSLT